MTHVDPQDLEAQKVHAWARALACGALLTSTLAAVWSTVANGPYLAFVWWAPVVIVAMPLLTASRRTFERLCLISAALLVVLAIVGCYFALFIHLPAAFILLAAALADPRGDRSYRIAVAIGVTLTLAATAGWAGGIYRRTLSPPDMFIVHTSSKFDVTKPPFNSIIDYDGSGIGYGAESVSYTGSDDSGPILHVRFRTDLSADETDRLRGRLRELPEVTDVQLCNRLRRDC
jgi:hypothetical protein